MHFSLHRNVSAAFVLTLPLNKEHTARDFDDFQKLRRMKPALPSTETPPDRGKMKMSDLIYWNPSRNHMK